MTYKNLTDPELVSLRQSWEKRLADPDDSPVYLRGHQASGFADMYSEPARRVQQALVELDGKVGLLRKEGVFKPLCIDSGLHGVHFIDKIFGADVYELDGDTGNWQVKYLSTKVGSLDRPDLANCPTWKAARDFATAFIDSGVTVPVFMLPTIASALNIGLNLYGQELLLSMITEPEAADHDLQVINDVLKEIHNWYQSNVPFDQLHQVCCGGRYQPPGCCQICGCSTQLVSPEQYLEFIAPRDDAILSCYANGGMIHLCGTHTQHIPIWRDMTSLTAVQVNDRAAEDLETYLKEMPTITYYVNPCDGMPRQHLEALARDHKIIIIGDPDQ